MTALMNYLCLCILSTFLFVNIGKIERKSYKNHTADYVADCNEQQRFTTRKICKILTLLCRNTVKLLSFCNIFGVHCRHNTCRNIEHICNAVFKSADYKCANREKYTENLTYCICCTCCHNDCKAHENVAKYAADNCRCRIYCCFSKCNLDCKSTESAVLIIELPRKKYQQINNHCTDKI